MKDKDVCRYLGLVNRLGFILTHSGVDWRPEYAAEKEAINKEIAGLRVLINQEHEARRAGR